MCFGMPPAPPTPPVFRAVLPHKEAIVQRILHSSVRLSLSGEE